MVDMQLQREGRCPRFTGGPGATNGASNGDWVAKRGLAGSIRGLMALVLALAGFYVAAVASPAYADLEFDTQIGPDAGEVGTNLSSIAVDGADGTVFIAERSGQGQNNFRINAYTSEGDFLFAFGWGVKSGAQQFETCNSASGCQAGLSGFGVGQFGPGESRVAVDNDPSSPSFGDLFVFNSSRIQRFSFDNEGTPADRSDDTALFELAWGGGVISGGASGYADITAGSDTITNVETTSKAFRTGMLIAGAGIPTGSRITGVGPGTIKITQQATADATGAPITSPEGPDNVQVNEVQVLSVPISEINTAQHRGLAFTTPNPSPTTHVVRPVPLPNDAPANGPGSMQELLESFSNIEPGDVSVTGPNGGPYTIEFQGRYADTDVDSIRNLNGAGNPGTAITETIQAGGASAEICTPANSVDCVGGVPGFLAGQFSPSVEIALGLDGELHVADSRQVSDSGAESRVQRFDSAGALISGFAIEAGNVAGIGVSSVGDIYFAAGSIHRLGPDGSPLGTFNSQLNILHAAVGSDDMVHASDLAEGLGGSARAIYHYDASGQMLRVSYGDVQRRYTALAPYANANGDVFAIAGAPGQQQIVHVPIAPDGPTIAPGTSSTQALGNTYATLRSRLNPQGDESNYHFELVTESEYQQNGFAEAIRVPEDPGDDPSTTDGVKLEDATAEIGCTAPTQELIDAGACLSPDTSYRFRVVAENAQGGPYRGEPTQFKTRPPFELGESWSSDVENATATLHAEANPRNILLDGYIEYVNEQHFQESGFEEAARTDDLDFGSGTEFVTRSASITDLSPATTYRYRLVVENSFGIVERGQVRELTTFAHFAPRTDCDNQQLRSGRSAELPDCRAYEMVSPQDKNGGDATTDPSAVNGRPKEIVQAAPQIGAEGRGITYSSLSAFADPAGAPYVSQYLAARSESQGRWLSEAIAMPRQGASIIANPYGFDTQWQGFSSDLRYGWIRTDADTTAAFGGIPGYFNLYRRDNNAGSFSSLCAAQPPNLAKSQYLPGSVTYSADGQTSAFRANDKLTPNAASTAGLYQLYGCSGNERRLLSVLPGGAPAVTGARAGSAPYGGISHRDALVQNAVSADGSRVYWSDSDSLGSLYLRKNPFASGAECSGPGAPCTVNVSKAVSSPGSEQAVEFQGASTDGTTAIFKFKGGPLVNDLYSFDAESGVSSSIAEDVGSVLGMSDDAMTVYFSSRAVLDEGAVEGANNLYRHRIGAGYDYIARSAGLACATLDELSCSRVSPDGDALLFASSDPLTGADNKSAANGERTDQFFRYEASSDELSCVSCNPTGARPRGEAWRGDLVDPSRFHSLHAPRTLSVDGDTIFFESYDGLSTLDNDDELDVYRWIAEGSGDCGADSDSYSELNDGCVDLISTGADGVRAEFLEASADGSDVFIRTRQQLSGHDNDDLLDIYDARVEGGFAEPEPPVACEGESCQGDPADVPERTEPESNQQGSGNPPVGDADGGAERRCKQLSRRAASSERKARMLKASARSVARRAKTRAGQARRSGSPARSRSLRTRSKTLKRKARAMSEQAQAEARRAKQIRRRMTGCETEGER